MSARRRIPLWPFVTLGALIMLGGIAYVIFESVGFASDKVELQEKAETTQHMLAEWDALEIPLPPKEDPTPVTVRPGTYEEFAVLYVPRWGKGYVAPIVEGDRSVEVSSWVSVDHYPSSQMPGELGNFGITAHNGRMGSGRFSHLNTLEPGDKIYVETVDGWYVYGFTHVDVIKTTQNEVLAAVPYQVGVAPTESIITLMACTYIGQTKHRRVAFGDFLEFVPRADGVPAEVASLQ